MSKDSATPPHSILDLEHGFNQTFRQRSPIIWWATLIGPFAVTGAILVVLGIFAGGAFVRRLVGTGFATGFLLGRFVILGGDDPDIREAQRFFSRLELTIMVIYLDMMTACVLAFHSGFLFKLPWVGKRLAGLVEDGQFILQLNPWMRRATFAGLVAFVMFPLAATGSVGGSIFGRLLGLSRGLTFTAVMVGSLLGSAAVYFGAGLIAPYIDRDNPLLLLGGAAVIVGILFLLNSRYQQMKRAAMRRSAPSV